MRHINCEKNSYSQAEDYVYFISVLNPTAEEEFDVNKAISSGIYSGAINLIKLKGKSNTTSTITVNID